MITHDGEQGTPVHSGHQRLHPFVTGTEIDHSRQIIQELLEVVVEANQIGLEVSEIEGDAVLFFKFGETPDQYRSRWQEGVQRVEELSHHLPRVGMRSLLVTRDREELVYASSCSFRPDRIEFSETDADRSRSLYFTLESLDAYRTRVTVDFYVKRGPLSELWFRMTGKRKMEVSLARSLANLDAIVKELRVPVEY